MSNLESGRNNAEAVERPDKRSYQERVDQNLQTAVRCCSQAMGTVLHLNTDAVDFQSDEMPRNRHLFMPPENRHTLSLAQSLFGPEAARNFARLKEIVDGKHILAIGGGNSLRDITSSAHLVPASLINVDPFLKQEDLAERSASKEYYRSLPLDPTQPTFMENMQREGLGPFDEIWATFSLPYYCRSGEEVETLFANCYQSLRAGGTLRIFPIGFMLERMDPKEEQETLRSLKAGLSSALEALAVRSDVELSMFKDPEYDDGHRTFFALIVHKRDKEPGFE